MKILVVEDNMEKLQQIKELFNSMGITDYVVEKFASNVLRNISSICCDIIITDLDIPVFSFLPVVENPMEGLDMLYSLKHMGYNIPTIIYSTTEFSGRRIDELKLFDYSFCGQAYSVEELEVLLKKVILKLNQDIETDPSVKYGEYVPVLGRDRKPKGLVRDNNI